MTAPSYHLTNYTGAGTVAADVIALIETDLTTAGWEYVEQVAYTQSGTPKYMRVWRNPVSLNGTVTYYIGIVRDQAVTATCTLRVFEDWDATNKRMIRPVLAGGSPTWGQWTTIRYVNGKWWAFGAAGYGASSTDGITWSPFALPTQAKNLTWRDITYGAGIYVAVSGAAASTNYMTSTDGITWTWRTNLPSSFAWQHVYFAAGVFALFAESSTSQYWTSTDGTAWTTRSFSSAILVGQVTYGGGVWAVTNGGVTTTTGVYTTSNIESGGAAWVGRTLPSSQQWRGITYNGTRFVATNVNATAAYSTDGATWTAADNGLSVAGYRVAWSSGVGLFLAWNTNTSTTSYATSPNGQQWTSRSFPFNYQFMGDAGPDRFIMCYNGVSNQDVIASTNGINWTYPLVSIANGTAGAVSPQGLDTSAASPAIAEGPLALAQNTDLDVLILASKSYLAVAINDNATSGSRARYIVGLYDPAWTGNPVTTPPLMMLSGGSIGSSAQGVSRALGTTQIAGQFGVTTGPDSLMVGNFTAGADAVSGLLQGARVALFGGNVDAGLVGFGLYGSVFDLIAVAEAGTVTARLGDTVTIGSTVYRCMGQQNYAANAYNGYYLWFIDTAAGS